MSDDESIADEPFVRWCDEFELHPSTIMELAKEGFTTMLSVQTLTSEIIEEHFKMLNLGQRLLLKRATISLQSVQPTSQEQTTRSDRRRERPITGSSQLQENGGARAIQNRLDSNGHLSVDDLMRLWGNGNTATTSTANETTGNDGKVLTFDPFLFLGTSEGKKATYRCVTDYVSLPLKDQRFRDGDSALELSVTNGKLSVSDRKLPLDKVNNPQYFEASLKILREMVRVDKVNASFIMDYIGYLIKISTMAQVFQWQSVLVYDREYRKAQADQGFNWDADNSYLMQLLLKAEGDKSQGTSYQGPARVMGRNPQLRKYKTDPNSGRQICERFNGRFGCKLQHCRYSHVCLTCFSNHSDMIHRKNTEWNSNSERYDMSKN